MSEYNPDKFTLLEITLEGEQPFYKVFGTWAGSYLYGDSWRMNSGIERAVINPESISFIGASGSIYIIVISRLRALQELLGGEHYMGC